MKVKIEGVLTPTRPMHIATALSPKMRFNYDTGQPTFGDVGMPLTGTVRKGLLAPGQDRPEYVPYFPSNDLRGRLRREAARQIHEHLAVINDPVTIDTFDGMNAGNFRGRPDNTPTTLEEMREFTQHFFMGLFGGGPRTLPSKLVTHDLDPIYASTLAIGAVPERFSAYAFPGLPKDMIDYFSCIRRDDTSNFTSLTMMDHIKDGLEAINDRQDELTIARNKRKSEKKQHQEEKAATGITKEMALKKDDLANMFAYQCMRAGLPLYLELGFSTEPTNAHVGLLLESLLRLFNLNQLGGRVALGAGRFRTFANLVVDGRNLGPVIQEQSSADKDVDPGYVLTDLADEFVEAKDAALAATSSADLNRFFVYGEPATPLTPADDAAAEVA